MEKCKRKTAEVVRPDYQPTEAERREDMRVGMSFEELTRDVLTDSDVRQTDKPTPNDV